ncbi:MAG: hypothetical protein GAK35_03548 [Herbaspirillum frisingense]|uniref:DUF2313 domain-containing protein n=1 Tax=Herbaspirillum frisingense TaxID=92645 RepID=A0A7V8FU43_9BURK|nr:MAG: hypothetical protein GAK35_03548 [Herbaspirillum frisingense]
MRIPAYTSQDFVNALQGLLPPGSVWPRDQDSVLTATLRGLAPTFERQASRARNLLIDANPATTVELLPEWEETLGLPDPCAGTSPTIQQRRAQVVARFANSGGQSIRYFINFAADLGYTISTREFAPFRCGQSAVGDPVGGEDWAYTWAIVAPLNSPVYFSAGQSAAGEALAAWQNQVLECELRRVKPAHTILQFFYL